MVGDKPEPGLPTGWQRTVIQGQLMWAKSDGSTAVTEYETLGAQRRHVVIVQGPDGERLPYDECAAIAAVLSHGTPLALVPASFRGNGADSVVLVETTDMTLADIWDLIARVSPEESE